MTNVRQQPPTNMLACLQISVKQKYRQILVASKKEISDGYMAYFLTQEASAIEQNSSSRDGKKEDRKEEVTDRGFDEVMIGFCLPGRYSLVFIDVGHQLELFFLL